MKNFSKIGFIATVVISIMLIIAGFLIPPMGVIDGSVLTAVGELFAFAALIQIPTIIQKGSDINIKHGNTELTINNPEESIKDE